MIDIRALRRPTTPNTYLLAPEGFCLHATPDAAAPIFPTSPAALYTAWLDVLNAQPRTRLVEQDPETLQIAATQRSAILGFIDDVAAQILPAASGASLAIYSRSRVGRYDFGVNRKRIVRWIAALEQGLAV